MFQYTAKFVILITLLVLVPLLGNEAKLAGMKNNRSPGEKGLIEAVKLGFRKLPTTLKELFNKCLRENSTPTKSNIAITVLIIKKGDISDLENSRLISFVSHLYKRLEERNCIFTNRGNR